MPSFKKPITNISSQEELLSVLTKALKLGVKVRFEIPLQQRKKLKNYRKIPVSDILQDLSILIYTRMLDMEIYLE